MTGTEGSLASQSRLSVSIVDLRFPPLWYVQSRDKTRALNRRYRITTH